MLTCTKCEGTDIKVIAYGRGTISWVATNDKAKESFNLDDFYTKVVEYECLECKGSEVENREE